MTVSELLTRIRNNVGDPNGRIWTDTRLVGLINESQNDVAVLLERVDPTVLTTTESLSQAGGDADVEITLPTDFRRVVNLIRTDVSASRQVKLVPMNQIFLYRGVDVGEVGYVRHYDLSASGSVSDMKTAGRSVLGFLDLANGTTYTYTLYYAQLPQAMTEARQSWWLQIPEEYHHLVEIRVTVRALAQENKPVDVYDKLWTEGVQLMMQAAPRRDGQVVGVR